MIVRTYANQFEYIGGFHGEDKFLTFEGSFLKGEYLILIESINLNEIKPKLIIYIWKSFAALLNLVRLSLNGTTLFLADISSQNSSLQI